MPIQAPKEKPATQQARASGLIGLRPVERRRGIRQFAGAVIERALAAADAAEIEAQHREAAMHEGIIELVDDLVDSSCRRTAGADAGSSRSAAFFCLAG